MTRYRTSATSESYVSLVSACPTTTSTMHTKRVLSQKGRRRRGGGALGRPVCPAPEEDAAAAAALASSVMAVASISRGLEVADALDVRARIPSGFRAGYRERRRKRGVP